MFFFNINKLFLNIFFIKILNNYEVLMNQWLIDLMGYLTLSETAKFFLPRIIVALIAGTIIGLEREIFNKTAGMKTLMLVCLGSTLFATISIHLGISDEGTDKTRIIAQIVSGIGFLGAGVILQQKGGIVGMTSAANIWFTGAIGCIIGIGEYELAVGLSLLSVFFLISFRWFEGALNKKYEDAMPHFYHLKIDCDPQFSTYTEIQTVIKNNSGVLKQSSYKKINGTSKKIDIKYTCTPKNHVKLFQDIQDIKGLINLDLEEVSKES